MARRNITRIGVITGADSRVGKEVKTAISMAVEQYNNNSASRLFSILYRNASGNPLQAAYAG